MIEVRIITSLNSAICFCENKTNTDDGAFFALLEPDPRVEPLCESAGVAADAGVSAAVSAADSGADSSFAFFFLTFFSLSAYNFSIFFLYFVKRKKLSFH
jgi:hypothetical protein